MYVSMSRLRISEADAPALVAAFRARARLVDDADGFVDLQVWQSDRDRGEVLMVSRWRDRDAFKACMRSEERRVSHGRIPRELKDVIRLERLEHLHTYEVVAEAVSDRHLAAHPADVET
jgi:heme oxygenase (mycobilin-producing)